MQFILELAEDCMDIVNEKAIYFNADGQCGARDLNRMLGQISTLSEVIMDEVEKSEAPVTQNLSTLNLKELRAMAIRRALEISDGNHDKAANLLGVGRSAVTAEIAKLRKNGETTPPKKYSKSNVIQMFDLAGRKVVDTAKLAGVSPMTVYKRVKETYGKYPKELKEEKYEEALKQANGNQTRAAKIAGISPRTMRYYLQKRQRGQECQKATIP